jgi:hypothetical protein
MVKRFPLGIPDLVNPELICHLGAKANPLPSLNLEPKDRRRTEHQ